MNSTREIRSHGFDYTTVEGKMVRVGVVGTREPSRTYAEVAADIDAFRDGTPVVIVTGGARGVDSYGMRYAAEHGLPLDIYWPLWDTLGRRAGFLRNVDIVEHSDVILAWPGIGGSGTQHTVNIARESNTPCISVEIERLK